MKKRENIENYCKVFSQRKYPIRNAESIRVKEIGNGIDKFLDYCYNLDYTETPNYNLLKLMFDEKQGSPIP